MDLRRVKYKIMKKTIQINGQEIGYILYSVYVSKSSTLYINQFMVYPLYRRKGYFKILLQTTHQIAKDLRCPTMTLSVGSMDETEDFLFALYEKYGFKKIEKGNWMQSET